MSLRDVESNLCKEDSLAKMEAGGCLVGLHKQCGEDQHMVALK